MKTVSGLLVVVVSFIAASQGRGISLGQNDQSSGTLANLAGSFATTFNRLVSSLGAVFGLGGSLVKTAPAVSVVVDPKFLRSFGESTNDLKVSIVKDSDSVNEMIRITYKFVNDENFDDFDDRSSEFDFDLSVELNSKKLVSGASKEIKPNSNEKVAKITIDLGKILEDLETSEEARITLIT